MSSFNEILTRIEQKKAHLDSFGSLPPELIANLSEWMAIEITYNSNAIEGNTLSAQETAFLVEQGITFGGKNEQ